MNTESGKDNNHHWTREQLQQHLSELSPQNLSEHLEGYQSLLVGGISVGGLGLLLACGSLGIRAADISPDQLKASAELVAFTGGMILTMLGGTVTFSYRIGYQETIKEIRSRGLKVKGSFPFRHTEQNPSTPNSELE